jgi:UDP-N-acetylmuramoylalanine-D-glutamate ligase
MEEEKPKGKSIIVCGGRGFKNREFVFHVLDKLMGFGAGGIVRVAHGNASGVDSLAQDWAEVRGVECVKYPALWKEEGLAAGPLRNQRMLDAEQPDLVVAFPGGKGTADMVQRAKNAGIATIKFELENPS